VLAAGRRAQTGGGCHRRRLVRHRDRSASVVGRCGDPRLEAFGVLAPFQSGATRSAVIDRCQVRIPGLTRGRHDGGRGCSAAAQSWRRLDGREPARRVAATGPGFQGPGRQPHLSTGIRVRARPPGPHRCGSPEAGSFRLQGGAQRLRLLKDASQSNSSANEHRHDPFQFRPRKELAWTNRWRLPPCRNGHRRGPAASLTAAQAPLGRRGSCPWRGSSGAINSRSTASPAGGNAAQLALQPLPDERRPARGRRRLDDGGLGAGGSRRGAAHVGREPLVESKRCSVASCRSWRGLAEAVGGRAAADSPSAG